MDAKAHEKWLLNLENQSYYTHLTLSLSFHSFGGARCFSTTSPIPGEPPSFFHGDRYGKQSPRIHITILVVSVTGDVHYMGEMKRVFLEKFFPASRSAAIRKEICGI
ncbi:hypothetical protein CR513_17832, partial [Mucuna pruriens]